MDFGWAIRHSDAIDEAEVEKTLDDMARKVFVTGSYWHMNLEQKIDFIDKHVARLEDKYTPDDKKRADIVRLRLRKKLLQRERAADDALLRKILEDG